jgi:hypothetical protein
MYTDSELLFTGAGQAVLNIGVTASTDHVDTLAAGDAIAPGARIMCRILTQYTDVGGGTIIASVITDSDPGFATAPVTIITGPTITIAAGAATAAGAPGVVLLDAVLPPTMKRYFRVSWTLSAALDAGAMEAFVVLDSDKLLDRGL